MESSSFLAFSILLRIFLDFELSRLLKNFLIGLIMSYTKSNELCYMVSDICKDVVQLVHFWWSSIEWLNPMKLSFFPWINRVGERILDTWVKLSNYSFTNAERKLKFSWATLFIDLKEEIKMVAQGFLLDAR